MSDRTRNQEIPAPVVDAWEAAQAAWAASLEARIKFEAARQAAREADEVYWNSLAEFQTLWEAWEAEVTFHAAAKEAWEATSASHGLLRRLRRLVSLVRFRRRA